MRARWNVAWRDAAVGLGLAAAAWLLYQPVLRLWWTHDDLFHLHYLRDHAPAWYLWDAAAWRQWPARVLTPLLFLSLDADRALFGARPAAFYVHQLVSLSLVTVALYGVLRLWLPRLWAALGALVFLLGPPVASMVPLLMERHYIEAVLLGALSCGLWVLSLRRSGRAAATLAAASAVLWFLAAMAKEIAVPLVLFLPLIPEASLSEESLRDRLRRAVPLGVALLAYVAVRAWFLGTLGGGYGFAIEARDLPWAVLDLPGKVAAEIRGVDGLAAGLLSAVVFAALAFTLACGWQAALRLGFGLALALAPVLPVSTRMEPRFAVPAWLVATVAFAFAGRALTDRGGRWNLAAMTLVLAGVAGGLAAYSGDWPARLAAAERQSTENRFFLTLGPGDFLRRPLAPPGTLGELRWWKEEVLRRPGGGWFLDDLYLCLHPEAGTSGRVWAWDAGSRRMADRTPEIPDLRRRFCSAVRRGTALGVELRAAGNPESTEGGTLSWSLGPWKDGRYRFLMGDGVTVVEVPRTGAFRLPALAPVSLRVQYEAPEGWVTYSPELTLDPARSKVLRWRSGAP